MGKKTRPLHILSKRLTSGQKIERDRKRYFMKWKQQKAGMAIILPGKVDFKEEIFLMAGWRTQTEGLPLMVPQQLQ